MSLTPEIPDIYNKLFAGWVRLEPRCRSDDFAPGLEARTADPLWLLGRQWQFGEFAAEDAGSPIDVEVTYRTKRLEHLVLQTPDGIETRGGLAQPLEMLVEQESVATLEERDEVTGQKRLTWDWHLRVRAGQRFERFCRSLLADQAPTVIEAFRVAVGVTAPAPGAEAMATDRATRRFRQAMAGRVVDGWRLRQARAAGTVPATAADLTPVFAALDAWWGELFGRAPEEAIAWQPARLDYDFGATATVSAGTEVVLSAPSYRNGDFDWHSCVVTAEPEVEWADENNDPGPQHYPPTRVTFAGMPHPRWWAFEDSRTDFGALDVATPDVAKLALMEFALIYGDDWFIVPLGVPLGSITKITTLLVKDVFGQPPVPVPPAHTPGESPLFRWEMYALTRPGAADGGGATFLFVPPALGFREESEPIEEVRFLRDEGANMVWGVEHLVPNGLGNPVDGFDAQTERRAREREQAGAAPAAADAPGGLAYRLATTVPANWIPFMPAEASTLLGSLFPPAIESVRLCRAQMLRNEADERPVSIDAMTRLLNEKRSNPLLWLDEEAVPREGVKVQLTKQRVRWTDGKTYVWLGKKVLVGRGEGRSGLRFDVAR